MAVPRSIIIDHRHPSAESSEVSPNLSPCAGARGRGPAREAVKFFTIPEVAECLNVSTRTVRRWIERGELAVHRFGAAVRIAEADLKAFLAQHREG